MKRAFIGADGQLEELAGMIHLPCSSMNVRYSIGNQLQ
jgi:hypothetical protein